MKVSCPTCQTNYNIDDKRIPPGGAKLKCARCQNTFPIRPPRTGCATRSPFRCRAPPRLRPPPSRCRAPPRPRPPPFRCRASPRPRPPFRCRARRASGRRHSAAGAAAPQSAAIPLPGSPRPGRRHSAAPCRPRPSVRGGRRGTTTPGMSRSPRASSPSPSLPTAAFREMIRPAAAPARPTAPRSAAAPRGTSTSPTPAPAPTRQAPQPRYAGHTTRTPRTTRACRRRPPFRCRATADPQDAYPCR